MRLEDSAPAGSDGSHARTGAGLSGLAAELLADARSGKAIAALFAGGTSGLGLVVIHVAFGSYVFSGPLAAYSAQGVGLLLFGCFAACLLVALGSGFRGAVAGLPAALPIVMALVVSTADAAGAVLFATTVLSLVLAAVASGALCLAIGHFRLAGLVRFIPYPVASGFVAGIGGAICVAVMAVMGSPLHWGELSALFEPGALWTWAPGVLYGTALYLATRRWRHPAILPVSVLAAAGAFHAVLAVLGIGLDEARAAGLVFAGAADGALWPALLPADLARVDWPALAAQIPNMLAIVLVTLVAAIMSFAGFELAADVELDWDREFRVTGLASIVSGAGGGMVGMLIVPGSLRSKLFGAQTRLTGIVAAAVVGGALLLGSGVLVLAPVPLVGGILFFSGLGLLDEGLWRNRKRLPRMDYAITVLIFVVITCFGVAEGVAVGMLAALVIFSVRLSRIDPVEAFFTGAAGRSSKARPVPERVILDAEGDRLLACRLRGYLFFGGAMPLADKLRRFLGSAARPPSCLALDFSAVSGADFSAVHVLGRFMQTTRATGVRVVLSGLSDPLARQFERSLAPAAFAELARAEDADRALEACEDMLLADWDGAADGDDRRRVLLLERVADDMASDLQRLALFETLVEELDAWLERRCYAVGETIPVPSEPSEGTAAVWLLAEGRASGRDPSGARTYQRCAGDALQAAGAAGASGRSAERLVADEFCRLRVLTADARHTLEEQHPQLALRLYGYLLR